MYGLVNYQLSPIQKGIQFGHAVVEYGQSVKKSGDTKLINRWNDWADNWKTFIILDGGTTNLDGSGTINKYLEDFRNNEVFCQEFSEPDLGDQITAFVFIVDERVFNRKKYPDYSYSLLNPFGWTQWKSRNGGEENVFLREFLQKLKLAQ